MPKMILSGFLDIFYAAFVLLTDTPSVGLRAMENSEVFFGGQLTFAQKTASCHLCPD